MENYVFMNKIVISGQFIGGFLVAIIGIFVYVRNRHSGIYTTFALICLSFLTILFGSAAMFMSESEQQAVFFDRLVYVGVVFVPIFMYHFSLEFTNYKKQQRKILYLGYVLSFIFLYFSQTNLFLNGLFKYTWGIHSIAMPLHTVFLFFMFAYFVLFFGNLVIFYKKYAKGIKKDQARYIFLAFFILAIIGPTGFFPAYRISIYPFAYFGWIIFTLLVAYAIVKHRLMDIRLLVLKSVAYTLSLAFVVAGYISLTLLVFNRFEAFIDQTVLDVVTLLALVFTFQPLRKFIEKHTDKLFSKGRYSFRELLGQLSDITKKHSRNIKKLTSSVLETLTKEMRIGKAAFILTNSPVPTKIIVKGFKSRSKTFWSKTTKIADEATDIVVCDELDDERKEKEVLRKAGVEVLIPIKIKGEMEGVLALGEKSSGDMYTAQDLNLLEIVAPQVALALENAKSFTEKEQRIEELKAINNMFQNIEHFVNLDHLLQEIVDEAIRVTGADGGSLMMVNKNGKSLSIKTAVNLHPLISLNAKIKVGQGLAGIVARTHEPLILNGLRDNKFKEHLKREDIVSAISVPMKAGDKLVGVLNVNRKNLRVEFSNENLNVMIAFAAQAAEAIEKAGYYNKIEKLSIKNDNQFKEFTKALAKTVDAKDPYTYGHSEAVTNYTLQIAKEMGFNEEKLRLLEIGGRLHDMGKIGVAEHILNKPGGLTDEEFKEIQRHPEIGARILQDTSSLKGIRDLILYHHERFDGKGYPTGLKGKDIPLGARILAVADTFDAMTSHRAYRKALSRKVAVAEIKKCSGTQFDPEIVDVFLKVLEKKRFRLIKNTRHQAPYRQKPDMMEADEK